jgi:hypothetical protein
LEPPGLARLGHCGRLFRDKRCLLRGHHLAVVSEESFDLFTLEAEISVSLSNEALYRRAVKTRYCLVREDVATVPVLDEDAVGSRVDDLSQKLLVVSGGGLEGSSLAGVATVHEEAGDASR